MNALNGKIESVKKGASNASLDLTLSTFREVNMAYQILPKFFSIDNLEFAPLSTDWHFIDLTGQRFGRLTVLGYKGRPPGDRGTFWYCLCDCGTVTAPRSNQLRRGVTTHCGCVQYQCIPRISHEDRFWSRVDKNGPVHPVLKTRCWLWIGSIDKDGYGFMSINHRNVRAHRYAFYLAHGRWPMPMGLHKCDNRPCVRQDHLFEGTLQDNYRDMVSKGRHHIFINKTHCVRGHEFTDVNTLLIRRKQGGTPQRHCRECNRIRDRAYKKRLRQAGESSFRTRSKRTY